MGHEMTIEVYLTYVVACAVITLIPGPTVTVIVANSLAHGTRAWLLNVTAMVVAIFSDGAYAVLSGRAGAFLTRKKVRLVSRLSGGFLIGGGVWLALTRR